MNVRFESNRGKNPWCLDLGIISGARKREYYPTEKEANRQRILREQAARESGRISLDMTPAQRLEFFAAKELAESMGVTIMQGLLSYQASPRILQMGLVEAIFECVEAKRITGKRDVYVKAFRRALDTFSKDYPNRQVSSIGRMEIEKWIRRGSPALATMRSRYINIQTFFNFCIKRKWAKENPAKEVEPIMADARPPGLHSVDQVRTLLNCALQHDPGVLGYIAPIYFGGLRPIESATMTAALISGGLMEVTPAKAKTRRRRLIPVNETLAAWLAVPGVKFGMDTNCIPLVKIRKLCKMYSKEYWPHDVLRHSFCSYGLPKYGAAKIAEWAGHSETILFAHYRERVLPTDVEKYWALRP